jgi:DNA-binding NarL/FixJ family response regulator
VAEQAVRVLLADAHPLLRAGLRTVLGGAAELHVVGEAGDGEQALRSCRRLLPDVVLVDAALPRLTGYVGSPGAAGSARLAGQIDGAGWPVAAGGPGLAGWVGALARAGSRARVLVLADAGDEEAALAALRAGAAGFLVKDSLAEELIGAVRAVVGGGAAISPGLLRTLLARLVPLAPEPERATPPALDALTDRERQVLVEVARGHSNAEIAMRFAVSETTVKTHVGHLLTKLGLRDRVQAVVLAYESGLIRPGIKSTENID